jgi:hypothetical protein
MIVDEWSSQMTTRTQEALTKAPVVIVGAGPVGLAAAAHLVRRGQRVVVLEAGDTVGANVAQWAHVRFFSPWKYSVDTASRELLEAQGWKEPDPDAFPPGRDLVEQYLVPLAATPELAPVIRLGSRVVAIARRGYDKMKTAGRDKAPFLVQAQDAHGRTESLLARAVIDASGTWTSPNPLGASGVPAIGENELGDDIAYGIPDVLGADRARYAGRHVLVAGSGHSAFNVIVDLATLAQAEPETRITWVIRRPADGQLFGGGVDDDLPARGALGQHVRELVEAGALRVVAGFRTLETRKTAAGLEVIGERDGGPNADSVAETLPLVDTIIAGTGFRPDLTVDNELRLSLDPATESPVALAPLIDPNVHSCGTVPPHGATELAHPEHDFYIVGMKSYGRAPTFLLLTGYEQVRSVAAALAGDWESARDVQLVLPETGVCSTNFGNDACCGAACQTEAAPTLVTVEPRRSGKPVGIPVTAGSAQSAQAAGGCCS